MVETIFLGARFALPTIICLISWMPWWPSRLPVSMPSLPWRHTMTAWWTDQVYRREGPRITLKVSQLMETGNSESSWQSLYRKWLTFVSQLLFHSLRSAVHNIILCVFHICWHSWNCIYFKSRMGLLISSCYLFFLLR